MRKVLLVSDNEILNDLYVLNLEVYTGTTVTVKNSGEAAVEFLKKFPDQDVVVSLNMINGQETASQIQDYITSQALPYPFIVLGSLPKNMVNVINVPSTYNLQHFIRVVAKILGVTAKEMAEKKVTPFYPVPTKSVINLNEASCDLYLQTKKGEEDEDYILLLKKGSPVSFTVKKLYQDGVNVVYVNALDRLIMVNHVSSKIIDILKTSDSPLESKIQAVSSGFEFVATQLVNSPEVSQEIMQLSQVCVKAMEDISKDTPSLRGLLNILSSSKESYLYVHSMMASYIAQHVVKNISWGGEGHVEKINFVLFFHDIMLGQIYLKYPHLKYEEDILFDEKVADKDKEIVLNHARLSAEMMNSFKRAPLGADLLIKQHHGMTSGIGFALDYKDDISPLSKVVIIAESFVEEMMRLKDENPNAQVDVKTLMNFLSEKYKKHTYKKIIETLATLRL